MTVMNIVKPAAALVLMLAMPAAAQTDPRRLGQPGGSVTTADIQRLQDQVYDASNEVSRLRSRDQALPTGSSRSSTICATRSSTCA